jgi:catechol 2,3-dioxygenase-like lactoylglutathione lyase family enzyme
MKLDQIDHVAITVSDLAVSRAWYQDVLGLERRFEEEWGDVPTMMCAGQTCVALFSSDAPRPLPVDSRNTLSLRHIAFRVDRANFAAAEARFGELAINIERSDHGIAQSIYVRDPDGHQIEITTYEV